MLVCNRGDSARAGMHFYDLPGFLRAGDVMVLNETKVIPARLLGIKEESGIPVELLLLRRLSAERWEALVKPGRRLKEGTWISFGEGQLRAQVLTSLPDGTREVRFQYEGVFEALLDALGQMPLPPYIRRQIGDASQYQTIYARTEGSAAAPTAGLHFTDTVLAAIREKEVDIVPVLLHVGLGTFRPVKADVVEHHHMHSEYYEITVEAARRINAARAAGGRILCVGTTSVRTLETAADNAGRVQHGHGMTDIFIKPGYRFKACDLLLTNFHLPQSTLLMLVSAFMGRERALNAYEEAVRAQYRFFSFGDCMLIGNGLVG